MNPTESKSFESSMENLQKIVKSLESGALSLDQALLSFEDGVKTIRDCQTYLGQAEKRVEILTQVSPDGRVELKPFQNGE